MTTDGLRTVSNLTQLTTLNLSHCRHSRCNIVVIRTSNEAEGEIRIIQSPRWQLHSRTPPPDARVGGLALGVVVYGGDIQNLHVDHLL